MAVWLGILATGTEGNAQRKYMELLVQHAQPEAYAEVLVVPRPSLSEVVVLFRIPHSWLIFTREVAQDGSVKFSSAVEVLTILKQNEQKVSEYIWTGRPEVDTYEATKDPLQEVIGRMHFEVPPGKYQVEVRVQGAVTQHARLIRRITVRIPGVEQPIGAIWLARRYAYPQQSNLSVALTNLGGHVPYGDSAFALATLFMPALEELPHQVSYALYEAEKETEKKRRAGKSPAFEKGNLLRKGTLPDSLWFYFSRVIWGEQPEQVEFVRDDSIAGIAAVIDLHGTQLADRYYWLEVYWKFASGKEVKAEQIFATHWRNMPVSLYDLEVAIENLHFIVDKQTLRQLKRGNRAEKEARFRAFWASRDPTPQTVFNELMAEYYRRIDYAARAFSTGSLPAPDGLKTDRARIYIRYGPPASIRRQLAEKGQGVQEIWEYSDGKRFVFEATSSLDPFILVAHEQSPR